MKALYDEVCRRFPEVWSTALEDNADQPYTVATMIAEWLSHMPQDGITPELIERVRAFSKWCEDQPQTVSATDDIVTIWMVGFVETLFKTEQTRRILTQIITKETLTESAAYFKSWVGDENYERALGEYH